MRNEFIVLGVIAVAIVVVYFIVKYAIGPKLAAQFALGCIMEAEKRLFTTTNMGEEKLALAVAFIYAKLPSVVQMLYPESEVIRITQEAFNKHGKAVTEKLKLAASAEDTIVDLPVQP